MFSRRKPSYRLSALKQLGLAEMFGTDYSGESNFAYALNLRNATTVITIKPMKAKYISTVAVIGSAH